MLERVHKLIKDSDNWNNNLETTLKSFEVQCEYCCLNLTILQIKFVQLRLNLQRTNKQVPNNQKYAQHAPLEINILCQ